MSNRSLPPFGHSRDESGWWSVGIEALSYQQFPSPVQLVNWLKSHPQIAPGVALASPASAISGTTCPVLQYRLHYQSNPHVTSAPPPSTHVHCPVYIELGKGAVGMQGRKKVLQPASITSSYNPRQQPINSASLGKTAALLPSHKLQLVDKLRVVGHLPSLT